MNRLAWSAVLVGTLSLSGLAQSNHNQWALAQSSAPPAAPPAAAPAPTLPPVTPIPAAAKTGQNPETFKQQISDNIAANLARIKSLDTQAVKAARGAMVSDVSASTTTSTFKDIYAQTLATALTPLLTDPDLRVRIQATVLASAVANAVDNSRLEPVALKALQDPNLGVQIWGMKAAKGVMKYILTQPGLVVTSQLPKAIADIVVANASKNELARDGVDALYLDIVALQNLKPTPSNADVQQLITPALRILDARATLYKQGVPEDTDADQVVLTFFSNRAWQWLTPAQQGQLVQRMFDILLPTADAATKAANNRALVSQSVLVGKNLYIVADNMKALPAAADFLKAATFFQQVTAIPPSAADIKKAAETLFDAARKVPALSKLQ